MRVLRIVLSSFSTAHYHFGFWMVLWFNELRECACVARSTDCGAFDWRHFYEMSGKLVPSPTFIWQARLSRRSGIALSQPQSSRMITHTRSHGIALGPKIEFHFGSALFGRGSVARRPALGSGTKRGYCRPPMGVGPAGLQGHSGSTSLEIYL